MNGRDVEPGGRAWRSPVVYRSLLAFAEAAAGILVDRLAAGAPDVFRLGVASWHRDADGVFRESDRSLFWAGATERAIEALPERVAAVDALRSDPRIEAHLDKLVGTFESAGAFETSGFLSTLIYASSVFPDRVGFSQDAFDQRYRELEEWFYSATVERTILVPLGGVGGGARGPIALGDNVELDLLRDDEIERLLRTGVLRDPIMPIFTNDPPLWGLRIRTRVAKVIGGLQHSEADTKRYLRQQSRLAASLEQALAALRLYKSGALVPLGQISFVSGGAPGEGTSYSVSAPPGFRFVRYVLENRDRSPLTRLVGDLTSPGVRRRPYVQAAIRRFSFAEERRRPDDQIVDFMIAAEALLLGHMGEPEGELTFRLAMHAGHLLGKTMAEREAIAQQMKRAYSTRSAIVHGGSPNPKRWGSTQDHPITLAEFTATSEELLRRSIRRAVNLSARTDGSGPYLSWDAALLSAPRRRVREQA